MRFITKLLMIIGLAVSLPVFSDDADMANTQENVDYLAVDQVPERVMATVKNKMPNLYVTSVSRELWANDETYYVVYGSQVNRFWVLTVRADGKLMRTDQEGEPRPRKS